MELHNLGPAPGSVKKRKRVGRGNAAGGGTTAGRGTKGQNSRSGGKKKAGYEGGQNPIQRRLPKLPGFKNRFRVEYRLVNVGQLNTFEPQSEITVDQLVEQGLIRSGEQPVKVLGDGELTVSLTVEAHKFSRSASEKIDKAGGEVRQIQ